MTELDAEREQIRSQGEAFESLIVSPAWFTLRDWLKAECERSKGAVILTEAGTPLRTIRDRFVAWQEREKVLIGLSDLIDDQVLQYREMLEVEKDERTNRSTDTRANW